MSDAFIFLTLQQRLDAGASVFPLFYVATSLFTAMFAVPFGRLADRAGRKPVLLGGYALLACVYGTLMMPAGPWWTVVLPIALLGAYYAATDGVLTAIAAAVIAPGSSGSGLSFLATRDDIGRSLPPSPSDCCGRAPDWRRLAVSRALLVAMVAAAVLLPLRAIRAPALTPHDRGRINSRSSGSPDRRGVLPAPCALRPARSTPVVSDCGPDLSGTNPTTATPEFLRGQRPALKSSGVTFSRNSYW